MWCLFVPALAGKDGESGEAVEAGGEMEKLAQTKALPRKSCSSWLGAGTGLPAALDLLFIT